MPRSLCQRTLLRQSWGKNSKVSPTSLTEIFVLSGHRLNASKQLMNSLKCYLYPLLMQKESVATLAVVILTHSEHPAALGETHLSPSFLDKIRLSGQTVISMMIKTLTF